MRDGPAAQAGRGAGPARLGTARGADRSAAEFAILGALARRGPADASGAGIHGYELTRDFAEGALAEIIRLEPGMLYHYLKKLTHAGLITSAVATQEGRPDRHLHHLTPEGDTALRTWLAMPVRATREIRLDFLLKLFLAQRIAPALAPDLVAGQHEVMRGLVESLESQAAAIAGDAPDAAFHRAVLHLRLSQTRAALEWLESLEDASS